MAEFELIQRYFSFSQIKKDLKKPSPIIKSIGDDCAILKIPSKKQLVTSVDTLVSGVHFFADSNAFDIAYKALAVNVSDLAAMGAKPLAYTLAISLPELDDCWLSDFSQGLEHASKVFNIPLIGGDTTQGPLTITINVLGTVTSQRCLRRDNAILDEDIWVTGQLGDAAYALELYQKRRTQHQQYLWQKLLYPAPKPKFAWKLTRYSRCAIDISDGLLADLGHILHASKRGAILDVQKLPLSEQLINEVGLEQARQFALSGGDDYQLCFTAPPSNRKKIVSLASKNNLRVTRIGKIVESGFHILLDEQPFAITRSSWQHFTQ